MGTSKQAMKGTWANLTCNMQGTCMCSVLIADHECRQHIMPQCSCPTHSLCDTTHSSLDMRALMLRATTHTKPKRTMLGMRMQTQNVLLDSDAEVPAADWSDVSARLADFGTADVIASVQTLMTVVLRSQLKDALEDTWRHLF